MKTLVLGAGPIGSLYAHRLLQAGKDVTILARNERFGFIKQNGIVLVNVFTGAKETSSVKVTNQLNPDDDYDLVIVSIRKNKLPPMRRRSKSIPASSTPGMRSRSWNRSK